MATEFKELEHDLEWIEYLLASAIRDLDLLASKFDDEIETAEQRRLIVAYSVSFLDEVNELRDRATRLQEKGLAEWQGHSFGDGGAHWQRIASRLHGKALEHGFEHSVTP